MCSSNLYKTETINTYEPHQQAPHWGKVHRHAESLLYCSVFQKMYRSKWPFQYTIGSLVLSDFVFRFLLWYIINYLFFTWVLFVDWNKVLQYFTLTRRPDYSGLESYFVCWSLSFAYNREQCYVYFACLLSVVLRANMSQTVSSLLFSFVVIICWGNTVLRFGRVRAHNQFKPNHIHNVPVSDLVNSSLPILKSYQFAKKI